MILPKIGSEELAKFQWIIDEFGDQVHLPSPEKWKSMTATDIWLRVVSQVVVVGKADPALRLKEPSIRDRLDFDLLTALSGVDASLVLGEVLRDIGTRYVPREEPEHCGKVRSLIKNLIYLKSHQGGPVGFMEDVVALGTSQERWMFIAKRLSYISEKGARDFLTSGFGLVTDRIALDSRVMGVVTELVGAFPSVTPKAYAQIEAYLVSEVCEPLNISAALLDQLLFKFSKEILSGVGARRSTLNIRSSTTEFLLSQYCLISSELKSRGVAIPSAN